MEGALEALLFASGAPVSVAVLAAAVGLDAKKTREILKIMSAKYYEEDRGMQLIEINGAFQMCTNPLYYHAIRKMREIPVKRNLTQTLLETLAIVAYKQPVTKSMIEEIRGVNPDHAVNKLLEYGLIVENGRLDTPGKPILFSTSEEFIRHFGLEDSGGLPRMTD